MSSVRPLLFPRSLAIVGASPRNEDAVLTALESGITVYGVNPGRDEVHGLRCWPTIAELPEVPETAMLVVNHERVEAALEDALAAGVRAFVVPGHRCGGRRGRPRDHRARRRPRSRGRRLDGRPELHGRRRPRRRVRVDRTTPAHDAARPRGDALPVRLDGRRLPLARRPGGDPLRRVARRRGSHGRRRLPRLPRGRRGHPGDRAVPGDGAPPRRLRRGSRALRRGRKARRVPQGRPIGGGGPGGALAHGSARRVADARSRRCCGATGRSRSTTSTS